MEIPKYILLAIKRRARAAHIFNTNDHIISNFIDKNNIEVDSCHYYSGCESIVNPDSSAMAIIDAIKQK